MPQSRRITIQDIAEHANVSISTVSRVLNGTAGVTASKRAAVLQAMDELDYRPNVFAQSLASGQSMTIGVLTQNVSSPLYDAILRGVLQGLNGGEYTPIFADGSWEATRERQALATLLDRRVDGLIVLGGETPGEALAELAARRPLIAVGRDIPALAGRCLPLPDYQGAYDVTRHLIDLGHRQIVHITGLLSHEDAVERQAGYRQALLDAGLEPDAGLIVEGDYSQQSGVLAVQSLLLRGRPFSAIFAANDQMAYGARLALFRQNIRVPEDISLAGFDDQPASAYMIPPLTTIRLPAQEMGAAAAAGLLDLLLERPHRLPAFKAELMVRESTARRR